MYPIEKLAMVEAPIGLEPLFIKHARAQSVNLIRDEIIIIDLKSTDDENDDCQGYDWERFSIWWPSTSERMHILVPIEFGNSVQ